MEFEWDEAKSESNREKHGIDFSAARALLEGPDRVEIPARTEDERRWLVIGRIGCRVWSAVMTSRGQWTRIISVHRVTMVSRVCLARLSCGHPRHY
ncbi:MAG: BrnT family toxin [Verrucomicrobiota bacterium]|nr:BrnT family toxin [Verrucomicrobiota bacterium]